MYIVPLLAAAIVMMIMFGPISKVLLLVLRYEVDMLLHLCLTSRAEREEMIRLLSPRLKFCRKHLMRKYNLAQK